jgi:nicotinate-nucleotide adenylyltransferase
LSGSGKNQNVGLFGGTFDPVHNGHLAVAELAIKKMSLDRLIFIPAADPPHKKQPGASYSHRVAMLEIALAGADPDFQISLLEAERAAPSYTVDTLLELQKRLGSQKFHFIIGADSLLELHLWYRYRRLPELTDFIVAARPGISMYAVQQAINRLPGNFLFDSPTMQWQREDGAKIYYLADAAENVSSSSIRMQISRGTRPDTVSNEVFAYITAHGLYQNRVTTVDH